MVYNCDFWSSVEQTRELKSSELLLSCDKSWNVHVYVQNVYIKHVLLIKLKF